MTENAPPGPSVESTGSAGEVLRVFFGLGLTSFGGPVAHLGYFRETFVIRRRWLDEQTYADLVALCHVLPGPASSQVGMAIGLRRAGLRGLLAAWVGFTLPSVILLVGFAFGMSALAADPGAGWLVGLKAAAVGVVAHAVLGMSRTLTPDVPRVLVALGVAATVLVVNHPVAQVLALALAAVVGRFFLPGTGVAADRPGSRGGGAASVGTLALSRWVPLVSGAVLAAVLIAAPLLAALTDDPYARLADIFTRSGSLVFGGGHVVVSLLQAETVPTGVIEGNDFLAGYGAAQAVPGPLFTFASYLGAMNTLGAESITAAAIATVAIFLPGALLLLACLRSWERIRDNAAVRRALNGVNAGVVGLLGAALYDPMITAGIQSWQAVAIAVVAFVALQWGKLPAWAVVIGCAVLGALLV